MNLRLDTHWNIENRHNSGIQRLRRIAVIVLQHPAEPFTAFDGAANLANLVTRFNDLVAQPLMIPLGELVLKICVDSPMQRLLAEKDHSRKALVFETSEIPFEIGVQIGTP